MSWLKTREIYLDKEKPFSIFFKQNFEDESYVEVDIRKKQAGRPSVKAFIDLLPMWLDSKKISTLKLQDIRSIMHLIPQDCKDFYKNLQGEEGLEHDVDGFTGLPDFEIEEKN